MLESMRQAKAGRSQAGITLIELMIVVAIVGILATFAYPSYQSVVQDARRTEGHSSLMRIANMQELYYMDYQQYAADINDLMGLTANKYVTENGYYEITTASTNLIADFTLTARATGTQAIDNDCFTLTINHRGQKASATSTGTASSGCWQSK